MFAMVRSPLLPTSKSAPDKIVVSLNESATQQTALEIAAAIRPANKFSRVGMSFVERIEAKVRAAIREEVRIHPSKGKTLL